MTTILEVTLKTVILTKYSGVRSFAKQVGLDRRTVANILNGKRPINADEMITWAKALDIKDEPTFIKLFLPNLKKRLK